MSNSIGNLKNSGLQGNNFPWQLKMLQGLQAIYDEVKLPLTCAEDSIRLCDGQGHSLDIQADGSINVNVLGSIPVSLDCNDSITICNSSFTNDGVSSLNVHVTNPLPLEVNLDPDNDAVGMYGYTDINDPLNPTAILVNSAGQLDIRPLTCADKVSLCFNDGVSDVTVSSTNPLPVSQGTSPWVVSGSVGVTGEVEIINAVGNPIPVTVVAPVPVIQVNLDSTDDQVGVYGYINGVSTTPAPLNVDASGAVAIQDNGGSITVDGTVAATQSGTWNITNITGTVSLPTGAATETTLAAVNTKLTAAVRTPNVITAVGAGSTPAGAYSFSIANVGSSAGLVGAGQSLPAGVTINFDGGALNNTLGSLAYDASGTTFVITWIS